MNQDHDPHIVLSSVEAENVVHYRAVSRIAVASLLLGMLSATAMFAQLMWCVPIVGATLAIIALRTISRSETAVLGRGAAQVGLVLSLLFLASAVTSHVLRQRTLRRQARPHASKWIELVRDGQLREAHQLQLSQAERQQLGTNLQNYYEATREAKDDMKSFFAQPLLSKIVELGRKGQLRFEPDAEILSVYESGETMDVVVQRCAIDYEVDNEPQTLEFLLSLAREYNADHGEARWRVREVSGPDSADR